MSVEPLLADHDRLEADNARMLEELKSLYQWATNVLWAKDPAILIGPGL